MADIDDFDLDRSIAQAWAEFQSRLSEVTSMIDDTADLTIGTTSEGKGPPPYVRLSSPRPGVIRCEAASNSVLGEDFQLSAELLAAMERLGWQPPTVADHESTIAQRSRCVRCIPLDAALPEPLCRVAVAGGGGSDGAQGW